MTIASQLCKGTRTSALSLGLIFPHLLHYAGDFDMESVVNSNSEIATVKEVSEYLRVHPSTVYRMLAKRQLPGFRVGSDWRFSVKALEQWRSNAEAAVTAAGA